LNGRISDRSGATSRARIRSISLGRARIFAVSGAKRPSTTDRSVKRDRDSSRSRRGTIRNQ
jgi:hypothetical protein